MLPTTSIRWVVESISMSSPLHLAVRPTTPQPEVSAVALKSLVEAVFNGLEQVQPLRNVPAFQ